MNSGKGFLAIWSDVKPDDETDYLHWLTREHAQERLSVPGFLAVRVFRTEVMGAARFLIFYRLSEASVVASDAYLARLNAPTPWSQRIMPKLSNFVRGGGHIVHEAGTGEGSHVAPVFFDRAELAQYRALADQFAAEDLIVAARIFEVDTAATTVPTKEKSMRQGDASFSAMLLLESLVPLKQAGDYTPYAQVFALRAS
jgi:hypothetical protein